MKFTARRGALHAELVHLVRIASQPHKNSREILSSVYLEAKVDHVRLVTTDIDTALFTRCSADVAAPGSTVAPAKKLLELVRSLPEDAEISVELEPDHWLRIVSGDVVFRLACLPPDDFPAVKDAAEASGIEIPGEALKEVLGRVAFAITHEDARYYLAGALLILDGVDVAACATDGHRLAFARRSVVGAKWERREVLLPRVVVSELRELIDSIAPPPDVEFRPADKVLTFVVGHRVLVSKPIEGTFPQYQKVLDAGGAHRVEIARRPFANALHRTGLLASERSGAVSLLFEGGYVSLKTGAADKGEARETLSLLSYNGPAVTVGFNATYLGDFLDAVEADRVSIDITGPESQGRLAPVPAEDGADYQYVVMPMRL